MEKGLYTPLDWVSAERCAPEMLLALGVAALLHAGLIALFVFQPDAPPRPLQLQSFQVVQLVQAPQTEPPTRHPEPPQPVEPERKPVEALEPLPTPEQAESVAQPEVEPLEMAAPTVQPVAAADPLVAEPRRPLIRPLKRPPPIPQPTLVAKRVVQPKQPSEPAVTKQLVERGPRAKPTKQTAKHLVTRERLHKPPIYTPPMGRAGYLDNPAPRYPVVARRRGLEGLVVLRVQVSPDGKVEDVVLKAGSGHGILDRMAIRTVWKWLFRPANRGGQSVMAEVDVPIRFSLQ
uniref:Protein TonB n=1 Tax=Magnetococcus massalia (strain MO-1) TaxID=451514 RepID=A0A1S7LDY6_MAGMO|nr:Putative periplasmic protein TonB, links inner and outer membranes [Candidatus Magnetococcus massalia]